METQPEVLPIPDRKAARRAASLCAFATLASFLLSYGLSLLYGFLTRDVPMQAETNLDLIVNTLISDAIAMPLVWLVFLRRIPKNEALLVGAQDRMPLKMGNFLFFLPCVYVVLTAGSLTGRLVGGLFGGFNDVISTVMTDVHPLATLLCASIIAPVAEELFFRKAMIDRLSSFHPMDAILFSALLFGLIHGNLTQFLYAFPIGVLFGIVYWRTKNIRYTILLHMGMNTVGGLLPQLAQQLQATGETDGTAAMLGTLVTLLLGLLTIGLVVVGVVFLIRYRKRFLPIESDLPRVRKPFYLNAGFIVACIVFIGLFVFTEILSRVSF